MSKTKIRTALRNAFGARNYRITKKGSIHVYGQMPNSIETGWSVFGDIDHSQTLDAIEALGE